MATVTKTTVRKAATKATMAKSEAEKATVAEAKAATKAAKAKSEAEKTLKRDRRAPRRDRQGPGPLIEPY